MVRKQGSLFDDTPNESSPEGLAAGSIHLRRVDVAASIAHDLHAPLSTISTAAELLNDQLPAADRTRLVTIIRRQALRMEQMLDELLKYAHLPVSHIELQEEHVDMVQLLHEVTVDFRRFKTSRDLVVETGDASISAMVDREKVVRILQNLLDNAFQYSPPGSTVTARLLAGGQQSADVIIEVEDTGPGVPSEVAMSVFDPFVRLDPSVGFGHGLGLYTVRCLAEAHGGRAWVERGAEGGACFKVALPLAEPDTRSQSPND